MSEHNPASDPMNGPNRLFLRRTQEQREYDAQDWPGSNSFHPPHLRNLLKSNVTIEDVATEDESTPPESE